MQISNMAPQMKWYKAYINILCTCKYSKKDSHNVYGLSIIA